MQLALSLWAKHVWVQPHIENIGENGVYSEHVQTYN